MGTAGAGIIIDSGAMGLKSNYKGGIFDASGAGCDCCQACPAITSNLTVEAVSFDLLSEPVDRLHFQGLVNENPKFTSSGLEIWRYVSGDPRFFSEQNPRMQLDLSRGDKDEGANVPWYTSDVGFGYSGKYKSPSLYVPKTFPLGTSTTIRQAIKFDARRSGTVAASFGFRMLIKPVPIRYNLADSVFYQYVSDVSDTNTAANRNLCILNVSALTDGYTLQTPNGTIVDTGTIASGMEFTAEATITPAAGSPPITTATLDIELFVDGVSVGTQTGISIDFIQMRVYETADTDLVEYCDGIFIPQIYFVPLPAFSAQNSWTRWTDYEVS
ncbi:MAG: hypothetical protein E6Q97_08645 [Desulfurellales bacterium]|nr:MAG: hypothetical protein E6Q97_08645 [Desulfurellales bacterium]